MSSDWTTYKISTNYHGHTYDLHYWPNGAGQVADGYVTDFQQYFDKFTDLIDIDPDDDATVQLVTVTSQGKSLRITDTDDLETAAQGLNEGSTLSVYAIFEDNSTNNDDTNTDADTDTEDEYAEWNAKLVVENTTAVKKYKKVLGMLDHFATHLGTCHHCEETGISGRRYTYAYATGYSMCGACYDKLSEDDAEDWHDSGLPWDGDAPSAPLGRRDDYAELEDVKHLQYLLTRLGHMKLSDTATQTGSYQGKTERGVASFRRKYNVRGSNTTVYDRRTASKLAQVVRKLRDDGHLYI